MNNNISISQHSNIQNIKEQWLMLDKIAEKQTSAYINYTYYQTYEWNNFLSHHSTDGLGKMTTAMRYDLVMVDDKPFAIIPFAKIMKLIDDNTIERTSFHVPLTQFATHEEYVSSLPKNIYKNIRKSYNHLTTDGKKMELKVFNHDNMASDSYLRYLWHFYFKRKMAWRHKSYNAFSNITTYLKAVYEVKNGCATASLKKLKDAQLYVLEIDKKPAAFMIVYRHNKHLLMPRLAIDTSFSRYSPGILLILEATKLWMNEGIVDFDMCRGDERYKKEMGGINEPLCRIEKRI